jgi:hypothetical protein
MKIFALSLLILLVASFMVQPGVFAQSTEDLIPQNLDKRAQTGFKFLSVSLDARAAAMGDALTAIDNQGATAMMYNPAAMARMDHKIDVTFGQVQWIADITYNMGAAAFKTRYGTFGVNLASVDYGEFIGTIREPSLESNYVETGMFSPSALAIGIGYAYAISDKFAIGAGAKYAQQDLTSALISRADNENGTPEVHADFKENTMAFDFGIQYRTGFKSLNFAMSVRNFAQEVKYVQQSFELPLTFNVGLSMDVADFTSLNKEVHSFVVSFDTDKPRDFDSRARFGGEYTFMNLVHLRAGYVTPTDEQGIALGAGLSKDLGSLGFALDYAYTDFGLFDKVNRISAHLSF